MTFYPKINRLRQTVEDCAKFQLIPISGFRFIVLTNTHRDKVMLYSRRRSSQIL